ncbi:MAG: prolipoprotein diacylglyceryl transferase [bacterium]|nr:prolipoprotein diacylglyceryl transferase [bacterium]
MYPVLLTLGPLPISSFGLLLVIAFAFAVFVFWQISRVYELEEEKLIDLAILTFVGGLLGARLVFVLFHASSFYDLSQVLLIQKYPGMSFWGGLAGGLITFRLYVSRIGLHFWQVVDFAAVSLVLATSLGDIGCFLGGCFYGRVSTLPWALPVVGVIGKRFPIALLEALILLLFYFSLKKQALRFHFKGRILASALIFLGGLKFITEFFRGDIREGVSFGGLFSGHLFSLAVMTLGTGIFYTRGKRSFKADLQYLFSLLVSSKRRKALLLSFQKSCYNYRVGFTFWLQGFFKRSTLWPKILRKKLNVKPTPTNYQ